MIAYLFLSVTTFFLLYIGKASLPQGSDAAISARNSGSTGDLADQVHGASVIKTSKGPEKSRARAKKSPTRSSAAARLFLCLGCPGHEKRDRPGSGLSDRDVPPRTQASEVQLLATLADALGDSQFSMFAVSCAGPVALTYASAHPDRIRRLCLYGSFASGSDAATPELRDALPIL
jgi:pimeloyl-ACP methyl ester carboxylesterase